ncbi:MAG: hypothetical protein GY758_07490 [Fuerstiella sp.]|nr:hypothetical protein [Fuerstiella sp.]MCP4508201.1 hypothetical protein [Fuerstiella sp.]
MTIALLFITTGACSAAELKSLRLGYDGVGKVGKWLPITAVAAGLPAGEDVQLRAAFTDPRGDTCIQIADEGKVDADGSVTLSGCFRCGRMEGLGKVSLNVSGAPDTAILRTTVVHAEEVQQYSSNVPVQRSLKLNKAGILTLMTVGEVAGIEELLRNTEFYSSAQPLLQGVHIESLQQFPDVALALESIDYLLLTDNFAMSSAQTSAIQQWVRVGGNLLVSAGDSVTDFVKTELGNWLSPVFGIGSEPIQTRDLTSLQGYVQGASRIEDNRKSVPMAELQSGQSLAEVESLSRRPIIGRQSVGTGVVTLIAVDLNQRPLSQWPSLPQFYETLLFGEKLTMRSGKTSRNMRISQSGVSDLATQLMAAVDATSDAGRWSTWGVMGIIVVWLLLIGPVDYVLVTRVLKRPHFTWVTFPALIIGGAAVVYSFATDSPSLQLNQWHVVDVTADEGRSHIMARSWMSVSTPATMRTDVKAVPSLRDDFSSGPATLTWAGRPEDVFGGMYRAGGIALGRQSYTQEGPDDGRLLGLPFLENGSRSLFAEWSRESDRLIDTRLSVSGFGLLTGTFSHNLPFAISDCVIAYGNRVYRTRGSTGETTVLSAGDVWDSGSPDIFAFDLKTWLNGSRTVRPVGGELRSNRGSTTVNTPYDKSSVDPHYILTMASLFDTAGGSAYTGLSQALFRQMELSDTIRLNHAVLIGLTGTPATSLTVDNVAIEPTVSQTVVRLVLPVNRKLSRGLAPTREELEKLDNKE